MGEPNRLTIIPRSPSGSDTRSVYLIRDESDRVKIGVATDPKARLAQLQTGNPEKLELLATCHGGEPFERKLHTRYAASRVQGEWFVFEYPEICESLAVELNCKSTFPDVDWTAFPETATPTILIAAVVQYGAAYTIAVAPLLNKLLLHFMAEEPVCALIKAARSSWHLTFIMQAILLPFGGPNG